MAMPCSSSTTDQIPMDHTVYLSLGSNLGNRSEQLDRACQLLDILVGPVVKRSAYHESEPWGFVSENPFLNAVVCCHTRLTPRQLLLTTQRIERQLGRREKSKDGNYHDRLIDIDILLYDHITIEEPDLKIPHPLMRQRPFVMEPLYEILEVPEAINSDKN